MTRCNNCGTDMDESMKFCIVCGAKAEPVVSAVTPVNATAVPFVDNSPKKATITRCATCGAEVPQKMKFCAACGTQANHEAAFESADSNTRAHEPERKVNFNIKKIITLTVAAIVVIVAVIVAIKIFTPAKYEQYKGLVYIDDTAGSVIVIPSGKSKIEIDGYLVNRMYSLDYTVAAILVMEESGYGYSQDGQTLYLITDKPQVIADDVYSYWLSASGDAIAYTREYDPDEGLYELWYYSAGKATRLTSDFSSYNNCVISPDGKTVAFVVSDGDKQTGVIWNGKLTELGRDIRPLAVSNGSKYIYYVRNDAFYVQKGMSENNREKLGNASDISMIFANKDLSQIVYNSGSKASISDRGGGRESLSGGIDYFVMPNNTAEQTSSNVTIYGISDFKNTFYVNWDGTVVYINARFETANVAKNASNIHLANDGKTLIFLRGMNIYKEDGTASNAKSEEIVSKDVRNFIATDDGSAVFFVNDNDELYYQKGSGKPSTITNYFSPRGYDSGLGLFRGKELFYFSDDELYHSTGDKGRLVSGIEGDVRRVRAGMFSIIVTSYEDGDTYKYYSTDGNKFELIYQD